MQRKKLDNRGTWSRKPAKVQEEPEKKSLGPVPSDLEAKKAYLEQWALDNRIPGKIQSWYSVPSKSETSDWRIRTQNLTKTNRVLSLEGPYKGAKPPKIVLDIDAQIRKPHLQKFRKSILQIWFRATGDGRYGIAVQNILHTAEATREFKTFLNYLQHEHSKEILCCHQMQVRPVQVFDPAHPAPGSHITLHKGFGSDYLPIAGTGKTFNIIDWTPLAKEPWIGLPKRIREAIHPAKDDKFLECYAGTGYIAESLAPHFAATFAVDARKVSRQTPNVRYIQSTVDKEFFPKFFSGKFKEGKWTVYLDPPDGKALAGNVIPVLAAQGPERILLNSSNLTVAAMEIKRFRREGYMLRKIIPLDIEPGKDFFQVLFLFVPDRAGLLGRHEERSTKVIKRRENQSFHAEEPSEIVHFTQKRRH